MSEATTPFYFYTSQPLIELTGLKAANLRELLDHIGEVDGSSIYFHTHHYVREHHFLSDEYPSDFAFWVAEILQEKELGEKLAILDLRGFGTIRELRQKLLEVIQQHLENNGRLTEAPLGLEFHFRKTLSVIVPTGIMARNLAELRAGLPRVDINSIYYHLVEYRIRSESTTNDFSAWIRNNFQREALAGAIERLDPYSRTLEECREAVIEFLGRQERRQKLHSHFARYPSSGVAQSLKEKSWFKDFKSAFQRLWYQD